MSIINTSITKQPLKVIEVPLNKFNEEVIPHHQKIFEQHKTLVLKQISQNNVQLVHQEVKNKKKVIKQLKDLMYELDTLRAQVEDEDLDRFDTRTLSLRKIIINLISGYTDLEKKSNALISNDEEKTLLEKTHPFEGAAQIQLHEDINELKLKQAKQLLNEVENVNRDAEDLHEIFTQLNQMVESQAENVDHVEETVESTKENVQSGFKHLVKARKLKAAAYPVTGAFLGSIIGGPVGLIAGFKIGGLTALGCAIAGYTGGRFFKKTHEAEEMQTEVTPAFSVEYQCSVWTLTHSYIITIILSVMSAFRKMTMGFLEVIGAGVVSYGLLYLIAICLIDCDLELAFYSLFGKSPRKLKGKVVFITGASSGIGEAIARALAKRGVKLVITARRANELERVKKECLELSNGQLSANDILVIPFDVVDLSVHKKVFAQAVDHFGTLDILVNNAGRSQRALFEYIEMAVDKQMFDLNVFAVVNLSRIAVNYFNKKGSGHVAVVSSLAGVFGIPYSATYTASKHAIHGYFGALRVEKTDRNIAVTLLCPGPTFTNFLQESFTERNGEKYGIAAQATDRRMTSERCGELCAIALANKTQESWMGLFPMMPFAYTAVYFPTVSKIALKLLGPRRLFKFRDSKEVTVTEGKEKL